MAGYAEEGAYEDDGGGSLKAGTPPPPPPSGSLQSILSGGSGPEHEAPGA